MVSKIQLRFNRATIIGIAVPAMVGMAWLVATSVRGQACGASGNPYCSIFNSVPCTGGYCVAWSTAFPSDTTPVCTSDNQGNPDSYAAYVTVNPTTFNW